MHLEICTRRTKTSGNWRRMRKLGEKLTRFSFVFLLASALVICPSDARKYDINFHMLPKGVPLPPSGPSRGPPTYDPPPPPLQLVNRRLVQSPPSRTWDSKILNKEKTSITYSGPYRRPPKYKPTPLLPPPPTINLIL